MISSEGEQWGRYNLPRYIYKHEIKFSTLYGPLPVFSPTSLNPCHFSVIGTIISPWCDFYQCSIQYQKQQRKILTSFAPFSHPRQHLKEVPSGDHDNKKNPALMGYNCAIQSSISSRGLSSPVWSPEVHAPSQFMYYTCEKLWIPDRHPNSSKYRLK